MTQQGWKLPEFEALVRRVLGAHFVPNDFSTYVQCGEQRYVNEDLNRMLALLNAAANVRHADSATDDSEIQNDAARYAIDGALALGAENKSPPPDESHWLSRYWQIGRRLEWLENVHHSLLLLGLEPKTRELVCRFAAALGQKLLAAQEKYGHSDGWADPRWMDSCRAQLVEHVAKGDPRDVAAYCAFLWHHGESTAVPGETVKECLTVDHDEISIEQLRTAAHALPPSAKQRALVVYREAIEGGSSPHHAVLRAAVALNYAGAFTAHPDARDAGRLDWIEQMHTLHGAAMGGSDPC